MMAMPDYHVRNVPARNMLLGFLAHLYEFCEGREPLRNVHLISIHDTDEKCAVGSVLNVSSNIVSCHLC